MVLLAPCPTGRKLRRLSMFHNIAQIIKNARELVPVVVIHDEQDATRLSQAIKAADGQFIEITLRTKAALKAIEKIKSDNPHMVVGAGTVLTKEDAQNAIKSGADFFVSPGFDEKVVGYIQEQGGLMIPGTITPSEVQKAMGFGLDILKFFPAESAGGAAMIKAFGSVYPHIKFMPTGGIHLQNIKDYIALPNICAIGGSWVCDPKDIQLGHFEAITQKLRQANRLWDSL